VLQFSYVIAAIYGWWRWKPAAAQQQIRMWLPRGHLIAIAASLLVSYGLAQLLEREGYSAWPLLDSLTACLGLFATWMVARVYLENWIYWIFIDAVSLYLCLAQGLVVTAMLFALYLIIAAAGLVSWWRTYRSPAAA
jgi:nicotinamide mononucleotide transporter